MRRDTLLEEAQKHKNSSQGRTDPLTAGRGSKQARRQLAGANAASCPATAGVVRSPSYAGTGYIMRELRSTHPALQQDWESMPKLQ
jgi:hypothetical protein